MLTELGGEVAGCPGQFAVCHAPKISSRWRRVTVTQNWKARHGYIVPAVIFYPDPMNIFNFSTQLVGKAPCGAGKIGRLNASSSASHGCPHEHSQSALLIYF